MTIKELLTFASPRRPIGRDRFGTLYLLGLIFAGKMIPMHQVGNGELMLLALRSTALFCYIGIICSMRLTDLGWSRRWALLAIGPPVTYVMLAVPWTPSNGHMSFRVVAVAVVLLVFGGASLVFVAGSCCLALISSRTKQMGEGKR